MDCASANSDNLAQRYLAGTLDAQIKAEWEKHYLACENCAEQMELYRQITPALREKPPGTARRWLWMIFPVAAMVLIALMIPVSRGHKPPATPAPDLAALAKLDPRSYDVPVLRGVESAAERKFREAMAAYRALDWPRAIEELRASLELDQRVPEPRFFLGVSYMLNGNPGAAVDELGHVAASDSPLAEEAAFDLAKAYLALGKADEALAVLARCRGEFAAQAAALRARIRP
jgi:tetratricopeptide (TPR) repeat protein